MCSQVLNQSGCCFIHCYCVGLQMRNCWNATWFSGSLGVSTVDTCTVPTSTESTTTAWTLSVTTRWAWVLYHFFEHYPNTHLTLSPVFSKYNLSASQFIFSSNEENQTKVILMLKPQSASFFYPSQQGEVTVGGLKLSILSFFGKGDVVILG